MAYKERYNLGYSPKFDISDREEIKEDLSLTANPMATSRISSGTVTSGGVDHDIYVLGESDSFELKTQEEATVNLELKKAAPCYHTLFTGKVLSKELPIRNATVMVLDDNSSPLSSTKTDENGIYRFRNILKPGKYKVIASADGFKTSDLKSIRINQNKVTKLTFSLKKSSLFINGIVYGKILEAGNGKPIDGADIYLKPYEAEEPKYKTRSNHRGQYLIYNILPNNYRVVIKKQGYKTSEMLDLNIEKYNRICLYFELIKDYNNSNTISGIIKCDEKPVSNVAIFLYLQDKQENESIVQFQETNDNGLYLFANVESGTYVVRGKLQNNVIYEKSFHIK